MIKFVKKISNKIFSNKTAFLVIVLMFAAKFLGFLKNVFMAKYYGTTVISDSYQMAVSIPMIIIGIVLYSYQAFTKGYFQADKANRSNEYTCSFLNFIICLLLILTSILLLFSNSIIKVFAPGFNLIQLYYTSQLIIPIIVGTFLLAIANILAEFLRCKNCYVVSQVSYLIINIIEILTIFIAFYCNYKWLSYGYLIANCIYFCILFFLSYGKGLRYKIYMSKKDFNIFKKILVPVFLSSIITDVNSMVDKMFASKFDTGTISILSYATNIKTVFLIIAAGFLTVLFPKISKKSVDNKIEEFDKKIKESAFLLILIYIPITIFAIIFSRYIVKFVYFRGFFDEAALVKTTNCLIMYTIGITGISLRDLYIKALYCWEKGNFVIFISFISVLINIIMNFIFSKLFGYIGLPLATSLSVWCIIPILFVYYKHYIKERECELE